jgi:predicted nucleotide-binding protein
VISLPRLAQVGGEIECTMRGWTAPAPLSRTPLARAPREFLVSSCPLMSKVARDAKALAKLRDLVGQIEALKTSKRLGVEHTRWLENTLGLLERTFGRDSRSFQALASRSWRVAGGMLVRSPDEIEHRHQAAYVDQLDTAKGVLLAAADELESAVAVSPEHRERSEGVVERSHVVDASADLEQLEPARRRVLGIVADGLEMGEWTSGRKLRALAGIDRASVASLIRSLVPRYVRDAGSDPDDQYSLTLDGLLQIVPERASSFLEALLAYLRRRFRENPDFRNYTWGDLKAAGVQIWSQAEGNRAVNDDDYQFVSSVVSIANLRDASSGSAGPPPHHEWGTPRDIETLVECEDFSDFLHLLRRRAAERLRLARAQDEIQDDRSAAEELDEAKKLSASAPEEKEGSVASRMVFVVHGHDEAMREGVARFVEHLGLEVVVLQEKPNLGKTLIEKLEHHGQPAYAIVLATPDDEGHPRGKPEQARARARQNVILELGFFVGGLGRDRVCVVTRPDAVELPSDMHGVAVIPYTSIDSVKLPLLRELRAAGLPVDPTHV